MTLRVPVQMREPVEVTEKPQRVGDQHITYARVTGGSYTFGSPDPRRIRIVGIHLDILTSAVAGDRYPRVILNKYIIGSVGHPTMCHLIGTQATPASSSGYWSWNIGAEHLARSDAAIGYVETMNLPTMLYMDRNEFLGFYISNGDAGDTLWIKVAYEVVN